MACAACVLGISLGIGGIFLYRVLRQWLQKSSGQLTSSENAEHACDDRSVENVTGADSLCQNDVWYNFFTILMIILGLSRTK